MQKIIIKNFKAIKDTEIEIKKVLILIGEQATGKSTIAKLIYFFKSVLPLAFELYLKDMEQDLRDLQITIFYYFFGFIKEDFEITFYYNYEEKILWKIKSESGNLSITGCEIEVHMAALSLLKDVSGRSDMLPSLFTIAGRSTTVGYSDFFENTFYADLKIKEKEKILTTDEYLIIKFMGNVLKLKAIFKKYGGFEGLIQLSPEDKKAKLILIKEKAEKILKGKYSITGDGEKLIFNDHNEKSIYLSNSSSGQQEAIRIIQDIFYNIYRFDTSVLRIIEEPEAHLFPTAQKELVELFALMVNHREDNQLIITTHSPYILTAFNNLLFANRVVEYNSSVKDEVNNIIPSEFWLQAKDCSVYSLSRDEKYVHNCESIFYNEKGIIQQNYLDTVSEILGSQFNALYKIHAKTFKRK